VVLALVDIIKDSILFKKYMLVDFIGLITGVISMHTIDIKELDGIMNLVVTIHTTGVMVVGEAVGLMVLTIGLIGIFMIDNVGKRISK